MTIAAGLYRNLTQLFSGMSVVTFILWTAGLMLIVVEFFQPAKGILASCGAVLVLLAITVRMLAGGTLVMLFYMTFFSVSILLMAHMLMLVTQKRAWLSTSLALKLERSVREESDSYSNLLGREGIATTDIAENGHIAVDDINLFVTCRHFVPKGSAMRVVCVEGDSIQVESIDPAEYDE